MAAPAAKRGVLCTGRFRGDVDPLMERFNASIGFDKAFWDVDLAGSVAYARASPALTAEEKEAVVAGLEQVREEWASGAFVVQAGDEDIHTANERRLTELIGPLGGKLHTGRSRNDQVATDVRLWMRVELWKVQEEVLVLLDVMASHAEEHVDLLMAGLTHLQPAQPVRYSHWWLSHAAALMRDSQRLRDVMPRLNVMPLGSGALAGHAFGLDRAALAGDLGFDGPTLNSIDAVCDRDFIAEFLSVASLLMVHLSQFSEDVILMNWKRMVTLADAYSTGSSLMPQKKNPDALELLRGKTGRVLGHATGFLATLKGLPRSYNKDLQEDKEPLFDTVDTVHACVQIATGVCATLRPVPEALRGQLVPEMLATDLAEYLVRKGVPFRETHHVAGAAVKLAEDTGVPLSGLTLDQLQGLHPLFDADALNVLSNYEASVERKDSLGGTSRRQVLATIEALRTYTAQLRAARPSYAPNDEAAAASAAAQGTAT